MKIFSTLKRKIGKLFHSNPGKADFNPHSKIGDQDRPLTPDESVDEAIAESFPASDPPAHYSRHDELKDLH